MNGMNEAIRRAAAKKQYRIPSAAGPGVSSGVQRRSAAAAPTGPVVRLVEGRECKVTRSTKMIGDVLWTCELQEFLDQGGGPVALRSVERRVLSY